MKKYKTLSEFEQQCKQITESVKSIDNGSIIDGVINTKKYYNLAEAGKPKLLWILKEANSPDYIGANESWDYQDLLSFERLKQTKKYNIITIKRVILVSYGIMNNFLSYDNIPQVNNEEVFEVAEQIAYINVNKMPALASSNDSFIYKAFTNYKDIIKQQIESYSPDIVIFGNSKKYFNVDFFNFDASSKKYACNKKNTAYYETENTLYIHAYHPGVRPKTISESDYCNEIILTAKQWWQTKNK